MDLKEHRNESIEEEADNWWIKTRSLYIAKAISMLSNSKISVLDFGCGTGVNSYIIQNREDVGAVDVIDSSFVKNKQFEWANNKLNILDQVGEKGYDLILAMDVLEHLEDDRKNLEKLLNDNLLPKGLILITVPAYSFLWSSHDIRLGHKKRYNRKELREVVSFENSRIEYIRYGFSFMLIPLLLIRKWETFFNKEPKIKGIPQVAKWINAILYFLGKLEFIVGGARFGTSLFCIIRKSS